MELGGNIVLEGFDGVDQGKLIVIKKIAGSFVKHVSEKKEYDNVTFSLNGEYIIKINVKLKDSEINSENEDKNLFFALTNAIKSVESQL
ncbi:MAG: hypothetical protein ABIJ18_01655 [archaeon]